MHRVSRFFFFFSPSEYITVAIQKNVICCLCHRPNKQTADEAQSWMGYLTKAVTASATYLPSQVTDVFTQGRAFASVHLPFQGLKNVCAITV